MQQKFDTLTNVIFQQSQVLDQRFNAIDKRFDAQEASIKARFDEQTAAIRAQFEDITVPLTMLTPMVQSQGQDIKTLKNDVGIIKEQIADIKQDNTEFYIKFDRLEKGLEATNQQVAEVKQDMNRRFEQVDQRFDTQEQILRQILERLPKQL